MSRTSGECLAFSQVPKELLSVPADAHKRPDVHSTHMNRLLKLGRGRIQRWTAALCNFYAHQ